MGLAQPLYIYKDGKQSSDRQLRNRGLTKRSIRNLFLRSIPQVTLVAKSLFQRIEHYQTQCEYKSRGGRWRGNGGQSPAQYGLVLSTTLTRGKSHKLGESSLSILCCYLMYFVFYDQSIVLTIYFSLFYHPFRSWYI